MPNFTQAALNAALKEQKTTMLAPLRQELIEFARAHKLASRDELRGLTLHKMREFIMQRAQERMQASADELAALKSEHDELAALQEQSAALDARLADADAQIAAHKATIENYEKGERDARIESEIIKAATNLDAFNPHQLVAMLKPNAQVLENGEVIFKNVMPSALQDATEVVDFLYVTQPNLFKNGLNTKDTK